MKRRKNDVEGNKFRIILPFVIVILLIFLIAVSLSWENITRFFARLGITPPIVIEAFPPTEFTYTIPASQLTAGEIVEYFSNATDSSGNPNETTKQTFTVIYPETIHNVHFEDLSHNTIISLQQNDDFYIGFNITNEREGSVGRLYLVQLIDPDGFVTENLRTDSASIPEDFEEEHDAGIYTATKTGTYTAQIFVWTALPPVGFPISDPVSATIISSS